MTISNTNSRMDYVGNGATATYGYSFKIFAQTDLKVTKKDTNNIETLLVLTTDYTVTGVGALAGGTITLTAGNLPSSYLLTIRRVRPKTQGTDIRNQGVFYPEIHEDAFDSLVMIDQGQQDEIDRSIKASETTNQSYTLPAAVANNLLGWNSGATAIENKVVSGLGSITAVGYNLQLSSGNLSVMPAFDAAGTNTYTVSLSPAISTYETGQHYFVKIVNANTITNPTINFNGLGAKTIKKEGSVALVTGDMPANHAAMFRYDGTDMILMNPANACIIRDTARNLIIKNNVTNPNYQVDIDADEIMLQNSSNQSYRATAVNLTAGITVSGANGLDTGSEAASTWYHIWVIYNPTTDTIAGLLSLSATAPTMPSGYTYKALGYPAIYNDVSSNFVTMYQHGNRARCAIGTVTVIETSATSKSLATLVPTTAKKFFFTVYIVGGGSFRTGYIHPTTFSLVTGGAFFIFYYRDTATVEIQGHCLMESAQTIYAAVTIDNMVIYSQGWEY